MIIVIRTVATVIIIMGVLIVFTAWSTDIPIMVLVKGMFGI